MSHVVTILALLFVGAFSEAAHRPSKGVAVKKITRAHDVSVARFLRSADISAQRADETRAKLLQVSSMGRFQRWASGIDVEMLQAEYCHYLTDHVKAMTELFKKRHAQRKFMGFREFEYTNALRRSDYLLTSTMTKNVLESLTASSSFHGDFLKAIEDYNLARRHYDGKLLQFE